MSNQDQLILEQLYLEMVNDEGTFTHDGREYDLNKLLQLSKNLPIYKFPVDKLSWILGHTEVNSDRLLTADLGQPILITKWGDRWVVLDGAHRLVKAIKNNVSHINVKIIDYKMLNKVILNEKPKLP